MTQILNVKMSADEAIKIIRAMFDSNRMIKITYTVEQSESLKSHDFTDFTDFGRHVGYNYNYASMVTINSITPIIPTYSVGQEVMILATGEIGSISKLRDEAREKPIEINNDTDQFYHRSEICKIA